MVSPLKNVGADIIRPRDYECFESGGSAPTMMLIHMNYEITTATLDDVAAIKKIEDACFSVPWSEKSIEESLKNPCSHFYIARAGEDVCGYIGIQIFSGEGYVTNVATLPQFRKQGIARALICAALENEMEFLTLEVRQSNYPAISLYKKLGFAEVGVRPKFYREPTEDAILMTYYK